MPNPLSKRPRSLYSNTDIPEQVEEHEQASPLQDEGVQSGQVPSLPAEQSAQQLLSQPASPPSLPSPVAPSQSVEPSPPSIPTVAQQRVTLPNLATWKGMGQPSVHDRRSKVPFEMRYKKENVMVDKRLLSYFYDLMDRAGQSKVDSFNRVLLKVLIDAGYPIDPNLLERPFTWDDLPK